MPSYDAVKTYQSYGLQISEFERALEAWAGFLSVFAASRVCPPRTY
jgi:hypothetical protein